MSRDHANKPNSFVPVLLAAGAALVASIFSAAAIALDEDQAFKREEGAIFAAASVIACNLLDGRSTKKRVGDKSDDLQRPRKYVCWDRQRAKFCINMDYLGPHPTFGPDDFQRIFRVSRTTYDRLHNYLCEMQPFFRDGIDATKREKISSHAKILIGLKYLAYGTTVNAFRDYFQVGESTAMKCVKLLTKEVTNSPFRKEYFKSMTSSDARRVEAYHSTVHGVRGMIGSLDCSHVVWGNCPVAHHGQFQGKEGKPTLVVEAMVDHSLYVWHAVFGYCGTLNDLTIWDSSLLLQAMCDGTFDEIDFQFTIGGEQFQKLWLLVDGIYPPLSRFVKPISVPIGDTEALFSMWQEAKRKDVERFFGVFKKKFTYLEGRFHWPS